MKSQYQAKLWILILITLAVAACTPNPQTPHEQADLPKVVAGKLTVVDARANATIAESKTSAAYLTILNGLPETVRLRSVTSNVAMAMLHESVEKDGVLHMVPQENGIEIPAGEALLLEPGGKHIMLMNLQHALTAGEEILLTLTFEGADSPRETIEVSVPVVSAGQ